MVCCLNGIYATFIIVLTELFIKERDGYLCLGEMFNGHWNPLIICFFLQGPDHPHCLSYKLELGSDQEIPSDWYPFATVQFGMLDTCASGTEVRSLGVESDFQPQKHVHQRACYNIQVYPKALWLKLKLLELWPNLALDICFALLSDCVYVYACVFMWPSKEPRPGILMVTSKPSFSQF